MDLNQLILDNQKMIYALTHYFSKYNSTEDLFQVGCIGLVKAYRNYQNDQNTKFSTYAYPYILGEMKKYIREDKGIKVGRRINTLNLKLEKAHIILSQKLMREPSDIELANFLEIRVEDIHQARNANHQIRSIDDKVGDNLSLHEVISDKKTDINTLVALKQALGKLDKKEYQLIKERYINDMTQSETASSLGISQVQVSRHEQKILQKLKDKIAA